MEHMTSIKVFSYTQTSGTVADTFRRDSAEQLFRFWNTPQENSDRYRIMNISYQKTK